MSRRWLFLALALAACGSDGGIKDEDLGALVIAPPDEPPPIDVGKAGTDATELDRAFAMQHHIAARTLGAHTIKITSKYEVKEGDQSVDSLSDETDVEVGADGTYHALYNNSADYGREVTFTGGKLYLRPRYAKWHRRDPNDKNEAAQLLDQITAVAGDYFDLVAFAGEVTDEGAAPAGGHDGRKVKIALSPKPQPAPKQVLTQKKWRETVQVSALDGEAVLDADTGVPMHAHFTAALSFQRDGRTFTMTLDVGQDIQAGATVAIAAPTADQVVDTPTRLKEVDERDALLEGIAPPAKQSGGSGVTIQDSP